MTNERRGGGSPWILAAFALAHLVIFAIVYQTIYIVGFSGIGLYFADVARMFAHQVPYRDFVLEYPPFAVVFFALPRVFGSSYLAYYRGFQVEIILCDLVILATLAAIANERRERPAVILGAYTIFTLAVGPIIGQQFDLFPAAMTLLAVYCAARRRHTVVWVLLALGALTKLYPLLLAPVFLLRELRRREWKPIARAAGVAAATVVVVMLPLLVIAPSAIRSFFAYHAKRGIQIESTYAGLLLAADKFHLGYVGISNSFGSWNVTGQFADPVAAASTFVLIAGVAATYVFLFRELARLPDRADRDAASMVAVLGTASLIVVCAVLVTSKVLSPQYLVWALPLVPLVTGKRRHMIWGLFTLIGVMTYYIFPTKYDSLIIADDGGVLAVLVIRNVLLLVLGLLAAASLRETIHTAAMTTASHDARIRSTPA